MSVEAITWALRQPIRQSSAKFVLVVLANCASGDTFLAYPSAAYLVDATGQDRKTVVANLARLVEWGLIEDTGKRCGQTKQITVWRVRCSGDLFHEGAQKRNPSENGTLPKTDGKGAVFPPKAPQKRDTETSGTVMNRQSGARGTRLPADWQLSDELKAWALTQPGVTTALVELEAAKFRDYWIAVPGAKGVRLDWEATWRNWIRKADKPREAMTTPKPAHTFGAAAAFVPSESKLERETAYIHASFNRGQLTPEQRDAALLDARRKHGNA